MVHLRETIAYKAAKAYQARGRSSEISLGCANHRSLVAFNWLPMQAAPFSQFPYDAVSGVRNVPGVVTDLTLEPPEACL